MSGFVRCRVEVPLTDKEADAWPNGARGGTGCVGGCAGDPPAKDDGGVGVLLGCCSTPIPPAFTIYPPLMVGAFVYWASEVMGTIVPRKYYCFNMEINVRVLTKIVTYSTTSR